MERSTEVRDMGRMTGSSIRVYIRGSVDEMLECIRGGKGKG